MHRHIWIFFAFILFFRSLSNAQEWWEKEPYTGWSAEQVQTILGGSPWVSYGQIYIRVEAQRMLDGISNPATILGVDSTEMYRAKLLTALPVREAMLRSIALNQGNSIVSINEITKSDPDAEEARLRNFMTSNPENVLVSGDEDSIIVILRFVTVVSMSPQHTRVFAKPSELMFKADFDPYIFSRDEVSKLKANTWIETSSGKRVKISEYVPPRPGGLGALFIFKRNNPNCSPILAAADKELRFQTRLKNQTFKVSFDLNKMKYKGKLEY